MTSLVVCEKPSVAADVAKALSGTYRFERQPWGFASDGMLIAAAAGHLVAELPPERYDEKYKKWSYQDLPVLPDEFMYEPRDARAADRLRQIAGLMQREDVTEIVNACDAGREGELIFKLIAQFANVASSKTIKRAWFSSMTTQAIQTAFSALRDDIEMQPLEAAARSRAEADWLVGMNATRAATCTLGGQRQLLSLGRVQTPTLALVVRRDLEIDAFVPQDYFQVKAAMAVTAGNFDSWWRSSDAADATDRFDDKADAQTVAARVGAAGRGIVKQVLVKEESVSPPRLFDLTDLQREANRRHGMTAANTLVAAQALYETHKFLSYPRTDSRFITSDMVNTIPALIKRVRAAADDYHEAADLVIAACDPSVLVNDAKVTDHHAIIPTDAVHDLSVLSADERRIYDLVARRTLAALLSPQKLERTVVWVFVDHTEGGDWFRAAGRVELERGWRVALPEAQKDPKKKEGDGDEDEAEDASMLPAVAEGDEVLVKSADVVDRQTKAPPRFNEALLLGMMATAGRLVTDDEAAEAMKESGLGTPATRAATVERLLKVEYLERVGRQLRATAKGRGLIMALGDHPLVSPDLTGEWEQRLHKMERSNSDEAASMRSSFSDDVRRFAQEVTAGFAAMTPDALAVGRLVIDACPVPGCTGSVVESKRGWGCDSWKSRDEPGCGFAVWKEQSGKRTTDRELQKRIADVRDGKVTVSPPGQRIVLGACPTCEKEVVERQKSWGCSSWRSPKETGCGYVIWKTDPDGTEVDENRARDMLALGKSNAREKPPAFADCPRCNGSVVAREKFYGCDSWRSPKQKGCGTMVWRVQNGSELTEDQVREQLAAMVGTDAPKRKPKPRPKK